VLVQARAHEPVRHLVPDRAAMRRLVADTQPCRHYTPRGDQPAWASAATRIGLT
jgi:rhamnulokinase